MAATLVSINGESIDVWLELSDGKKWPLNGNCHIGRSPDNDIIIDSPKASREHAAIHAQDQTEFWILDLGSRNGTFRNEHRLLRPTRLREGDRLNIGGQAFVFRQRNGPVSLADDHTTELDHSTTHSGGATVFDFRQKDVWLLIADIEKYTELSREWAVDKLAINIGRWVRDCRRIIKKRRGRIPKYIGDGFLACWDHSEDPASEIAGTLRDLQELRKSGPIQFRVALHYGMVTFGELSELGEETMLGPEMNYIFRLEDLASKLNVAFCLSSSAQAQIGHLIPTKSVAGEHALKGFADTHRCYSISDDS